MVKNCKGCGILLREILVEKQNAPEASTWCKEGFHSMGCYKQYFEETKTSTSNNIEDSISSPTFKKQEIENMDGKEIKLDTTNTNENKQKEKYKKLNKNKIAIWGLFVGGGIFCVLNIATNGAVPGGAQGAVAGGIIGYVLTWGILAFIPSKIKRIL